MPRVAGSLGTAFLPHFLRVPRGYPGPPAGAPLLVLGWLQGTACAASALLLPVPASSAAAPWQGCWMPQPWGAPPLLSGAGWCLDPLPSCPRSSHLSCGVAVGCAARIPPPVGPSVAPEHSGKGGGHLVVTQLCAPQLRWSPYWGTWRGALHGDSCLPVSVKLHGWAVS